MSKQTKRKYQFAAPGPYTLQLSYSRLTVDENGQAEVDTKDAAMMRLVDHFGGEEVDDDLQKEKVAKADGVKKTPIEAKADDSETELKAKSAKETKDGK